MRRFIIFFSVLLLSVNLPAEGYPTYRKSNPNYKNLKVYARVLKRYGKSDCFLAQIDIINLGNSTVTFWETTYDYSLILGFTAGGIRFVNKNDRLFLEKKITYIPPIKAVEKKNKILAHEKITIETNFFINNRKLFLKTNKNLRVEFHFNDANLNFKEDQMGPRVLSENVIDYEW